LPFPKGICVAVVLALAVALAFLSVILEGDLLL